jgi:hypothetical protein
MVSHPFRYLFALLTASTLLPVILARDAYTYRLGRHSLDALARLLHALRPTDWNHTQQHQPWSWRPWRLVHLTDPHNTWYCSKLTLGVCWWNIYGRGDSYTGGIDIILAGCKEGWKLAAYTPRHRRFASWVVGHALA